MWAKTQIDEFGEYEIQLINEKNFVCYDIAELFALLVQPDSTIKFKPEKKNNPSKKTFFQSKIF
jgi:hypothetical protein